jgi:hypothetical protein
MSVLIFSLLAGLSTVSAAPSSHQKPGNNPARVDACTILTPDIAAKVATATKTKMNTPPEASPVGVNGSQCDYGSIALHLDPFATVSADRMRKSPNRDWVPVTGVGDAAFFHDVQSVMVEMIVWSGSHHFGILMNVPAGSTSEQLKPHMIQVANLIVPKLR